MRNLALARDKDSINRALEKLSAYLFELMNEDHMAGRTIDKARVRKTLAEFFGGAYEKDKAIALTEWIEEYIEKAPGLIKKNKENPLSQNTIKTYKTTLSKLKAFEGV